MTNAALRLDPRTDREDVEAPAAPSNLPAPAGDPPAPGPPPKRPGKGTDRRRVAMVRAVVSEVEALRPVLERAVRQYELRTSAQISEILGALRAGSGARGRPPPVETTSAMLRALRAIELKPARGRAKDLVRLHELVAELTELITPDS